MSAVRKLSTQSHEYSYRLVLQINENIYRFVLKDFDHVAVELKNSTNEKCLAFFI